jgi:hypothetical protein
LTRSRKRKGSRCDLQLVKLTAREVTLDTEGGFVVQAGWRSFCATAERVKWIECSLWGCRPPSSTELLLG